MTFANWQNDPKCLFLESNLILECHGKFGLGKHAFWLCKNGL
jgi:hypothetical protein